MDFQMVLKWWTLLHCDCGVWVKHGRRSYIVFFDYNNDDDCSLNVEKEDGSLKQIYEHSPKIELDTNTFDPKRAAASVDEIVQKADFDTLKDLFLKHFLNIPVHLRKKPRFDSDNYRRCLYQTALKTCALKIYLKNRLFGFIRVKNNDGEMVYMSYQTNVMDENTLHILNMDEFSSPYLSSAILNNDFLQLFVDRPLTEKSLEDDPLEKLNMHLLDSKTQAKFIDALDVNWATRMITETVSLQVVNFKNRI